MDRLYTKEHEWVKIDGERAIVGISEHAAHALGDITFIELPKIGTQVKQMEKLAVIESIKAVSDVYSPVTGKVAQVNTVLENTPELLNKSPEGQGWICILTGFSAEESKNLMSSDDYEKYVESAE